MKPSQVIEEIRRIDNVIQAFQNLLNQLSIVDIDSTRLFQYRSDLRVFENRLHVMIHRSLQCNLLNELVDELKQP